MKKIYLVLLLFLASVTLLLEMVNIYLSNKVAADSISATKINVELKKIADENIVLKSELLHLSSFEMISSRAADLGFVQPKYTISLSSPVQVAFER